MSTVPPRDARAIDAEVVGLVKTAIENRAVPLQRLADTSGIPRTTLKRKLAGFSSFTVVDLILIAQALEVPNDQFIAPFSASIEVA